MSMTIQRQAKTNNNNKKMDFENYDGNGVQTNRSLRDIYHFTMYNSCELLENCNVFRE